MSAPGPDKPSDANDAHDAGPKAGGDGAATLRAALAADPDLADELEMIAPMLDPGARERFQAALVEEIGRHARPAAAVLAALERAARVG